MLLRLATFNIADGYLFTTNRRERIAGIARLLGEVAPDVVAIQEAYVGDDRTALLSQLAQTPLRHHTYYRSRLFGTGLLTLSAHPVVATSYYRFVEGGDWHRIWEGDFWAGKGVVHTRIGVGKQLVDIYNLHAQAPRGRAADMEVRTRQMQETADFIRRTRRPGAAAFVMGDFNTVMGAPDYELGVREGELVPLTRYPGEIDHVFGVGSGEPEYAVEGVEALHGSVEGSRAHVFLDAFPTARQALAILVGRPERTPLSDHPGYLVTARVRTKDGACAAVGSASGM